MKTKKFVTTISGWLKNANIVTSSLAISAVVIVARILVDIPFYLSGNALDTVGLFSWGKNISISGIRELDILLLSPILNTLMFHTAFLEVSKYFKIKMWLTPLLSATTFSVLRYESATNFALCFISIAILTYAYILKSDSGKKAFLTLTLTHFIMACILLFESKLW